MEAGLGVVISVLVGALVGYVTNVIAVRLLFYPERPVGFWKLKVQGLIPARKEEIAVRMFNVVTQYVSREEIGEVLQDAIRDGGVRNAIRKGILAELRKLPFSNLYLDALAGLVDRLAGVLEGLVVREFGEEFARELANRVSLRKLVEAKMRALSAKDVEKMFRGVAGRELKFIEYTGFILGGLIGLIHGLIVVVFSV